MKTYVLFLTSLAQFFLEWEMFCTDVAKKINTYFMFIPPPKIVPLLDNVE